MVFVTAILQDACLSIKVENKPVHLNFHVPKIVSLSLFHVYFLYISFNQAVLQLFFVIFLIFLSIKVASNLAEREVRDILYFVDVNSKSFC